MAKDFQGINKEIREDNKRVSRLQKTKSLAKPILTAPARITILRPTSKKPSPRSNYTEVSAKRRIYIVEERKEH